MKKLSKNNRIYIVSLIFVFVLLAMFVHAKKVYNDVLENEIYESIKTQSSQQGFTLQKAEVEVLYDDRNDVSAGEKFADADLIGVPWRAVISEKTGDKIEVKKRDEKKTKLISGNGLLKLFQKRHRS